MFLSAWFVLLWFLLRGADATRPSALQRFYTLLWLYVGAWLLVVAVTVSENVFHLAGGYFVVFYFAAVFVALLISYLELLALPPKTSYAEIIAGYETATQHSSDQRPLSSGQDHPHTDEDDDATERTSLLRGDRQNRSLGAGYGSRTRAANVSSEDDDDDEQIYQSLPRPYENEQAWSGKLPSWAWIFQFIVLAPITTILLGQIGLILGSALGQTPADGSPVLNIYFFLVAISVFLLVPVTPFIHRFSFPIPTILFLIFLATLAYNLLAFPFSDQSRLKVYSTLR